MLRTGAQPRHRHERVRWRGWLAWGRSVDRHVGAIFPLCATQATKQTKEAGPRLWAGLRCNLLLPDRMRTP